MNIMRRIFLLAFTLSFSVFGGSNTVTSGKWSFTYNTENGFWEKLKWQL